MTKADPRISTDITLYFFEQAATACQAAGERLILLVDGLDEDGSPTSGPDAGSIAARLPAEPPDGMRVIVAGRPNPPIPKDVPGWHPLRDPAIVRPLSLSAYAQDVKALAEQELKRLLHDSRGQRDLVGFLTAARGGLSDADLVDLTGLPLWEVEDLLLGVSGRTLSHWRPETGKETYLLGHEELQAAAATYLGDQLLAGYRDGLHARAEGYRQRGWPRAPAMLPGVIGCWIGPAGTPTPSPKSAPTLDLVAAQDEPDLIAALRLAFHRDQLATRNSNFPTELPAVWATLGHHARAETLARSITPPHRQVVALARVAETFARVGQPERAAAVADQAETTARSITYPSRALASVCASERWVDVLAQVLFLDPSAAAISE